MSGMTAVNDLPKDNPAKGRKLQGKVVDNLDPLFKQRIKVEIPNLMEGPPEMLPWIGPLVQSKFGMTAVAVSVAVPVIDSVVEVEFQDGDLAYGIMTGSLHTEISALLGPLEINYPARRGWLDPMGNWSYIDITPGMVEFQLHHKSGTQYTTYDDGKVHHFAVELYHIEAPDIKETATFTHKVFSETSTHEARESFTLSTKAYQNTASETHQTDTKVSVLNATEKHTLTSPQVKVVASDFIEMEGSDHVTIKGGRVDINP